MFQGLAYDLTEALHLVEEDGLFVSLCTITRRPSPDTVDASGQADQRPSNYPPLAGHVNIACMLSVWRMKPDMAAVVRLADRYDTLAERHCLLDGYFPLILQRDLATIDGTLYEIYAVESDSQRTFTRLALRSFTQ
jgi:hypothetical protein